MTAEFHNKVVLISGGANGIGKATAISFCKAGATVVLVDIDHISGEIICQSLKEMGFNIVFKQADVSKSKDCERVVGETLEFFDRIDILFNNAGITRRTSVTETTEEEWDKVIQVNLKSVFLLSKFVIPVMEKLGGGVIVNTGSGWGLVGGAKAAPYCASKGGVVLLTKSMAIDHGRSNIRVNCVCPGDTDTNLLRDEALQLGEHELKLVEDGASRPLGRVGRPEDIANAVLFLSSEHSSFMTGETMVVDGGGLAGSQ